MKYLKTQIENDEHWRGYIEYKNYYESLKDRNEISFYDGKYSKKLEKIEDLDDFWYINKALIK